MTLITEVTRKNEVQDSDPKPHYFSIACSAYICAEGVIALCNAIDRGDLVKAKIGEQLAKMESDLNQISYNSQNSLYNNGLPGNAGEGIPYWIDHSDDSKASAEISAINSAIGLANQRYQPGIKTIDSAAQADNQAVESDANDKNSLINMAGTISQTSGLIGAMQAARA